MKELKAALAAKLTGTYELAELAPLFPQEMPTEQRGRILHSLNLLFVAPGVLFSVHEEDGAKYYEIQRIATAPKAESDQSTKLTMTLPSVVVAALHAKGEPLGMTGQEWLKHYTIAAYTQEAGVHTKLEKVIVVADLNQVTLGFEANKA
jgi:hypothetical protein